MQKHSSFSRRVAMAAAISPVVAPGFARAAESVIRIDVRARSGPRFNHEQFGFVGIYDVDWLLTPEFSRMLDMFADSSSGVLGVRVFGILSSGEAERYKPENSGTVWSDPGTLPEFDRALDLLDALTSRGLTPFLPLGFFPEAVSPSPIVPPLDFKHWKSLVRAFLDTLGQDPRFGSERIWDWWFEVWNEPNEGRFWSGTQDDYFDLYRATSEAVVESGLPIRLGGPAIAWKPEADPDAGPPWMERFLAFIAADTSLRCDFISCHRKGTVDESSPDPRRLYDAATGVRKLMRLVDPIRFAGIPIVNNEADEKVGFEVPFAPRMTGVNASWLAAVCCLHAGISRDDAPTFAAADNANLQLVEEPFDGRRSVLTWLDMERDELVKLPAFLFYAMLRNLDGTVCLPAGDAVFPRTDIYHLTTRNDQQIATLLTWYPGPERTAEEDFSVMLEYARIPWESVTISIQRIDRTRGNAWTAAGGSETNPFPKPGPELFPAIDVAQHLASEPIHPDPASDGDTIRITVALDAFATVLVVISPAAT